MNGAFVIVLALYCVFYSSSFLFFWCANRACKVRTTGLFSFLTVLDIVRVGLGFVFNVVALPFLYTPEFTFGDARMVTGVSLLWPYYLAQLACGLMPAAFSVPLAVICLPLLVYRCVVAARLFRERFSPVCKVFLPISAFTVYWQELLFILLFVVNVFVSNDG